MVVLYKYGLALRRWGIGFNEGSMVSPWLPTIHINQPQGMFYFSFRFIGAYVYRGKFGLVRRNKW